jgi:deoxyribodipyrimidine photolyase-related protein
MIESKTRGNWLCYPKKKLALIYSATRHFAGDLRHKGWEVDCQELGDTPDFWAGLKQHVELWRPERILITPPNDWPMTEALGKLKQEISIPIDVLPTKSIFSFP